MQTKSADGWLYPYQLGFRLLAAESDHLEFFALTLIL